jgi:hypothetical protein
MPLCRYVECGRTDAATDRAPCPRCEPLRERINRLVETGVLPLQPVHEFTVAAKFHQVDATCAACGNAIAELEHWGVRKYHNRKLGTRADLHLHDLCYEIWSEVATRE